MDFLGKLGIDWKLLLAQIINFSLLLLILGKFLYKPLVKKIEDEEAKLALAEKEKEDLAREKESFTAEKNKKIKDLEVQAKQIIGEAEEIARKAREEAQSKAEDEARVLFSQAKEKINGEKQSLILMYKKEAAENTRAAFLKYLLDNITKSSRSAFQENYFSDLLRALKSFSFDTNKRGSLNTIMEKFAERLSKEGNGEKKKIADIEKQLQDAVSAKIGPIILETAQLLSKEQGETLAEVISKKLGVAAKPEVKQNKKLIAGFRLEILGVLFEHNLAKEIGYGK